MAYAPIPSSIGRNFFLSSGLTHAAFALALIGRPRSMAMLPYACGMPTSNRQSVELELSWRDGRDIQLSGLLRAAWPRRARQPLRTHSSATRSMRCLFDVYHSN